jgi:tRNA pseudouridine55 synthase
MGDSGILVIDKPSDWTSMDVCAKLRGVMGQRRVGHAGTLDPMATGVLPVFLGRATRAVEFAADSDKEYIAGLQLGVITDTQDTTGTVLERRPAAVSPEELERALEPFRGEILQVPPMYSAVKRQGKKLYELARKGQEVERPPRPVTIHALEVLEWTGADSCLLRVACSKGTYVRTLCHDIGAALGCGGTLCSLRRTRAAGFTLADAVTLEQVEQAAAQGRAAELLLSVDAYFSRYPALTIDGRSLTLARNGNPFPCDAAPGEWRVYGPDGGFLLLGRWESGVMTTIKSFFEV